MKDVFISGWCGYPELFGDFASGFEFVVPFVTHSLQDIEELIAKGGRNLFAWSTGAYLMLDRIERPPFTNIVLVSPFMKFTKYTPARVLETMIRRFADVPAQVVADFYKSCGCDTGHVPDERHFHINLNGLKFLLRTEIDEIDWDIDGVTLLHGLDDRIVSVEASRDINWMYPSSRLVEVHSAGHFIPPETLKKYKI